MQVADRLDEIVGAFHGRGRDALLPVLWEVQHIYGYISREAVYQISHALRIPEADIFGVIGFYALYYDKPAGETIIRVCTDPSCSLATADDVVAGLCQKLAIKPNDVSEDGRFRVEHSPCIGMCDHAPAALVSKQGKGEIVVARATVDELLSDPVQQEYASETNATQSVMLANVTEENEYSALRMALEKMTPDDVIETIIASDLIGRGGAAFLTGMKWRFARSAAGLPKYLVCNADESEPGTFKDRVLMETRPHLVLEGMALAAYAIGAEQGYLFIRGEYPVAERIMRQAIDDAVSRNALGRSIFGTKFAFDVEIRRGAGAYICGEETALFEAIEGNRGFPRIKPPFPTTNGLFGKPTVINNVETLSVVPLILGRGVDWFAGIGTYESKGPKLVSVSGHVWKPGVYEIEPGITLRHLLDEICGGVQGELRTVLMGGAAGTFLAPSEIDVRLTFEDLRSIGSTFGSGAVMVFNDKVDIRDILQRLAHFFKHESCGKCFPCQLGTQRQVEILDRVGTPLEGDKQRLVDVGKTMTELSLCGLGQTAASAVLSALDKFPELYA